MRLTLPLDERIPFSDDTQCALQTFREQSRSYSPSRAYERFVARRLSETLY